MTTIRTEHVPAQTVFFKEGDRADIHIVLQQAGYRPVRLIDHANAEIVWTLEEARDVWALLCAMFRHVDIPPEKERLLVDPMSAMLLRDLLSLVMQDSPSLEAIESWTPKQRVEAELWAGREHLIASDNDLPAIPKPEFLRWGED